MIEPRLLGPLVVSKEALEVSLVEILLIALEVSDDAPVGMENPNVACPENELLAIEDFESKPVDDAAGVLDGGLGDGASFCIRRTENVKEVITEFPW